MKRSNRRGTALCTLALTASWALACTDTEQVFVERPFYEDPPNAAQGFLGYDDEADKLTVCGNCHVGQSGEWEGTGHARAWDDLQASGHAAESCYGCHTVGANGNLVTDENVGFAATDDARYHDVQCESCHGPGLEHVTNPDATQPLASIEVGVDLTSGCGECHQGAHNPFVEEWSQSAHGKRDTYPQGRGGECAACHEGKGALEAFGVKAEYLEKEDTDPLPITCAVCHDPHDPTNPKQLRFAVDERNLDANLCMKCHQRRAVPDPTSSRGPHSPQGPLLLGEEVGWRPPGFDYEDGSIVGTHGTERNPRLCATCHVSGLDVTDPVTGDFVFHATGHLFKPIPCLDGQGIPTTDDTCALDERSFNSCTASGCHGTEDAARSAYIVATDRIEALVAELDALIAQVPATEFDTSDGVYTVAEGANFNAGLGAITSSAIHNPFLTEALLVASIQAVETEYGVMASPDVSLANVLAPR